MLKSYQVSCSCCSGRFLSVYLALKDILPQLTVETLKKTADRIMSSKISARKTRQKEVEAFYKHFQFDDDIKPSFHTFRNITIIRALQDGISVTGVQNERLDPSSFFLFSPRTLPVSENANIQDTLKSPVVLDLVKASLGQWRADAVSGARRLLGFEIPVGKHKRKRNRKNKGTKAMDVDATPPSSRQIVPGSSTTVDVVPKVGGKGILPRMWHSVPGLLDPELRVTSWFVCTRCSNMDPGYKRMRVLDFLGLCAHVCWEKSWSKSQQKDWNISAYFSATHLGRVSDLIVCDLQMCFH